MRTSVVCALVNSGSVRQAAVRWSVMEKKSRPFASAPRITPVMSSPQLVASPECVLWTWKSPLSHVPLWAIGTGAGGAVVPLDGTGEEEFPDVEGATEAPEPDEPDEPVLHAAARDTVTPSAR